VANTIKIKRGTNLSNAGTPAAGELIYKTDTNALYVGDGTTAATGLTAITGGGSGAVDSIANFSNNRVLTASDSDSINGEANLTFDGSTLALTGDETISSSLVVGATAKIATTGGTGASQVLGTGNSDTVFTIGRFSNNTGVGQINFFKSRNGTIGSSTIVQDNDGMGAIVWAADDGTDFVSHAAKIDARIDGTPGANDTPGRLSFYTTADGSQSAVERMRIDSSGNVGIGTSSPSVKLQVADTSTHCFIRVKGGTGSYAGIDFGDNDDDDISRIRHNNSDNSLGFYTNNTLQGTINSSGNVILEQELFLKDDKDLVLGNGSDLQLKHDGSHSYIKNTTGDLYIQQHTDDKDIVLQSDDGSGNVTAYLTIDGSATKTTLQKDLRADDDVKIQVGSSGDFYMVHDSGTGQGQLINGTDHLVIVNNADDHDIILKSDNGSGGTTAYLTLDGSATSIKVAKNLELADNVRLRVGSSDDLQLYHDTSNSYITNATGDLVIRNDANDKDILFQTDNNYNDTTSYIQLDGSAKFTHLLTNTGIAEGKKLYFDGGSDTYITSDSADFMQCFVGGVEAFRILETSSVAYFYAPDSAFLGAGTSIDFTMSHDGSNSHLTNNTGHLYIKNNADDKDIILQSDDGSGGLAAYLTLDGGANKIIANENIDIVTSSDEMMRFKRSGADEVSIEQDSSQLYFYNRTTSKVLFLMSETGSAKVGYNTNPVFEIRNTGTSGGNGGSLTFGHNQDSSTTAMARISGYLADGSAAGRAGHLRFWTSRAGSDELAMQLQNDNKLRLYQPGDTGDYFETVVHDDYVQLHVAHGNYIRIDTDHGNLDMGPMNSSWCHFQTDRNKFYFNKQITVDSGIITSYDEDLSLRRTDASADRIDITADYTRVIVNSNEEFRVDGSGILTTGITRTTDYFQLTKSGATNSLLKIVNSGWSNETTHDILYNHWQSNLGDYTYLKSAGNSTSGHGIAMVADTVFAVGDTTVATGAVTNSATAPFTDTWFTVNGSGNGAFKGSITANGGKPVMTENGSWFGDLGSNGWTRVFTLDNGGGVMSWALKNGQMSTIIDGSHFAYEAGTNQGGGFYSSSDSSYANATGIVASGGTLYVKQADGTNASLFSTGDIICNSGYISGQGNDLMLRRTTNNDDRIVIEASETKIYGDAVERVRFGSYGIRNGYSGSEGGPVYSFKDDTDTGIWRSGGDTIAFSCGGTRMFTIESGGDLELRSDGSSQGAYIQRVGGIQFTWDRDSYGTNNYHAMVCDSDDLKINSYHNVTINLDTNDNNGSEAFQIRKHNTGMTNGTLLFQVDGSGNVDATADVIAYSSSDKRLKDNLKPISNSLEKLQKLTGYEFDWNDKQDTYEGHDVGVVAQEVEEVLPEVVATRDSGYKAVKYEKMIPLLIESIKELKEEINGLKNKLGE